MYLSYLLGLKTDEWIFVETITLDEDKSECSLCSEEVASFFLKDKSFKIATKRLNLQVVTENLSLLPPTL